MKLKTKIILFSFMISYSFDTFSKTHLYVVKRGDTLSSILFKFDIGPIYGKQGMLLKIVKMNKKLNRKKGNIVWPGMKLLLVDGYVSQNKSGDILISPKESDPVATLPLSEIEKKPAEEKTYFRLPSSYQYFSHSDLAIKFNSKFYKLSVSDSTNGSKATIISDASSGYEVSWAQRWSKTTKSYLSYESNSVKIQDSSSSSKVLLSKTQTLSIYKLGASFNLTNSWSFNTEAAYGESLVVRSIDSTNLKIEKFQAPKIILSGKYKIAERDKLDLSAVAAVIVIAPSSQDSYNSKLSYGKNLGIVIGDTLGSVDVEGQVFYKNGNLKMDGGTFDQSEVGVGIGIKKSFGDDN